MSSSTLSTNTSASAPRTAFADPVWSRRLAWCTAFCALPLFAFGGSVTTIGAGMAVDGWWVVEGEWFLPLFPVDQWFRDVGTFVEHTHRLFAMLVGLFSIATCSAVLRSGLSGAIKPLAAAGLIAICAQGTLGGFRVLENSPQLAFLHGVLAQAVFALLTAVFVLLSKDWLNAGKSEGQAAQPHRDGAAPSGGGVSTALAIGTTVVVFVQIALGAWYRHALRPTADAEAGLRFVVHLVGAVVATAMVVMLLRALRKATAAAVLRGRRRLHILLGVQILLGFLAWIGFRPGSVTTLEWVASVLHVIVGALLLGQCLALSLWSFKLSKLHATEPSKLGSLQAGAAL